MSADEKWKGKRLGTAQSFRRVFLVTDPQDSGGTTVDPRFDNELLTKAAPGTSLVGLPFAMAQHPRVVESLDSSTYLVEVPYEAPSGLQGSGVGSGAWQMRISGSLDTIRTDTERRTLDEIEEKMPPRIVGPFAYLRDEDNPQPFTPDGNDWDLYEAGGVKLVFDYLDGKRIPVGMDIMVPSVSITYRRLCADNNPRRVNEVIYHSGYVNNDEVRLPGLGGHRFLPGQLLLQSYEITEVAGNDEYNPWVHDISVTFAGNSEGWQLDYYHTWTDPNIMGATAAIVKHDGSDTPETFGKSVHTLFRRQFEAPFNGWIESLQ